MEPQQNIFSLEKQILYHKSLDYLESVYSITSKFPPLIGIDLTAQYREAADSVVLIFNEGLDRTDEEFNLFLSRSKRRIRECLLCQKIAFRREFISADENEVLTKKFAEILNISKELSSLIKSEMQSTQTARSSSGSILSTPD
jgi:four helix bundle protein